MKTWLKMKLHSKFNELTKRILPIHPLEWFESIHVDQIESNGTESSRKLYKNVEVIFLRLVRYWFRFRRRADKPLKRMIKWEKRERERTAISRKKNLIMSPHGRGQDRYQFIFRLKRDSLPQLHDATSATPFPPFRMACNSIFSKPIQSCGRASRNRIRVWHSCSIVIEIISFFNVYSRTIRGCKNVLNFSS